MPQIFVLVISLIRESHSSMSLHSSVHSLGWSQSLGSTGQAAAALGDKWPCLGGGCEQLMSPQLQSAPCPCLGALQKTEHGQEKNQINCLGVADSCRSHGPD